MKILLDTHLLLWWLNDSSELPAEARELIRNPENTIFISAVTLWEIRIKESLRKLRLPPNFDEALGEEEFENLALSASQVSGISQLPMIHRDPFDRMLIAQARATRMTLLTADDTVASYGDGVRLVGRVASAAR